LEDKRYKYGRYKWVVQGAGSPPPANLRRTKQGAGSRESASGKPTADKAGSREKIQVRKIQVGCAARYYLHIKLILNSFKLIKYASNKLRCIYIP